MSEATITDANENTSEGTAKTVTVEATTGEAMRELGKQVAHLTHGGDVILLSGPLAQENHLRTRLRRRTQHQRTHRLANLHHRTRTQRPIPQR